MIASSRPFVSARERCSLRSVDSGREGGEALDGDIIDYHPLYIYNTHLYILQLPFTSHLSSFLSPRLLPPRRVVNALYPTNHLVVVVVVVVSTIRNSNLSTSVQ